MDGFLQLMQNSAYSFLDLMVIIVSLISTIFSFIYSTAGMIMTLIPNCLEPWFWLILTVRMFKFLTKRGSAPVHGTPQYKPRDKTPSERIMQQAYMDKLSDEGK